MECEYGASPFISAMALDYDGVLLVGGFRRDCGTFGKFTRSEFEFYSMGGPDEARDVTCITADKDNNIWVTGNGLKKYDRQQFTAYTTENSNLPTDAIYDIKMDNAGNLWFAGYTCLIKFDERPLQNMNIRTLSLLSIA